MVGKAVRIVGALAACAAATAPARAGYVFCVAADSGQANLWITQVVSTDLNRSAMESRLRGDFAAAGRSDVVTVMCPRPHAERTDAERARREAVRFDRAFGAKVHDITVEAGTGAGS
ncbi:MAG: hypothetical protein KGI57_03090 [Hyphomicrobiales bacterium]|nr:hypothetical protein [Hyphomicrobiales bacterium]